MNNKNDSERIADIEERLSKLEYELQERYVDAGNAFLELASSKQQEVNQIVDEIIDTRKAFALEKKEKQCAQCLCFNSPDSRYCKRCGSRLDEERKN